MNMHEEQFINSFIVPAKRERCLYLLQSLKGRRKLTASFDHFHDLDRRFAHLFPSGQQSVDAIYGALKKKGAQDMCHVMSSNPELDNRDMELLDALKEVVGMGSGTLISCIPGRLAYFESEEMKERYILER